MPNKIVMHNGDGKLSYRLTKDNNGSFCLSIFYKDKRAATLYIPTDKPKIVHTCPTCEQTLKSGYQKYRCPDCNQITGKGGCCK